MMAAKTSQAIRDEILRLWRAGGWTHAVLGRKFGITRTTIHTIVDPAYAEIRIQQIRARRQKKPPPNVDHLRHRQTPSLAKV